MAAMATVTSNISTLGRIKPERKTVHVTNLTVGYPYCSPHTLPKYSAVRAVDPESRGGGNSNGSDNNGAGNFIAQEDVEFLFKLVAGSIVGGAGIKYGSIVFPEITAPNIVLALIMILTPVAIAIWLMIKQSFADRQS